MHDTCHSFRTGHRIMVQVQSSWFPLVDRNPQTFCDIYTAKDTDFQKATHRVYRSRGPAERGDGTSRKITTPPAAPHQDPSHAIPRRRRPAGRRRLGPGRRPAPPKGFTALFNGKDLAGWHGMPHFNPYDLAKMPDDKRKAGIEAWTADAVAALDGRPRRAGQRRQRGLLDHGPRVRRRRIAHRVQDRRQGRQRHLPPSHAASSDLGLHEGGRQVEPWGRQGERGAVE